MENLYIIVAFFVAGIIIYFISTNDKEPSSEDLNFLNEKLKNDPENPILLADRGVAFQHIGEHKKAIESFKKSLNLRPRHANTIYKMAIAYKDLGLYKETVKFLNKVLNINPLHYMSYIAKAEIEKEQYSNLKSIQYCNKAIKINPDKPEAYFIKALALMISKKNIEAIENFCKTMHRAEKVKNFNLGNKAFNYYKEICDYENAVFKGKAMELFQDENP